MGKLKIALMLLIGHALAVLAGSAAALAIFGVFHNAGSNDGSPGVAAILGGAASLAVALYPLTFFVVLPFTVIPAILLLSLRVRSLLPYLIAGAVLPVAAILVTRFVAVDDPFELERGAAMIAGAAGGVLGAYILWLVAIRPIPKGLVTT